MTRCSSTLAALVVLAGVAICVAAARAQGNESATIRVLADGRAEASIDFPAPAPAAGADGEGTPDDHWRLVRSAAPPRCAAAPGTAVLLQAEAAEGSEGPAATALSASREAVSVHGRLLVGGDECSEDAVDVGDELLALRNMVEDLRARVASLEEERAGSLLDSAAIARWDFEGMCGRGSGDSILDRSGNGNALTISDGACFTGDPVRGGTVWELDGQSTNQLLVSSLQAFDGGPTSVSMAAWVRFKSPPDNTALGVWGSGVIQLGSGSQQSHLFLRAWPRTAHGDCEANTPRFIVGADVDSETNSWWCSSSQPELQLHVWTHVALTYDAPSRTVTLYQDGQAVLTRTLDGDLNLATELRIGSDAHNDNGLNGMVDDAAVYRGALSATEVRTLYEATKAATGGPAVATALAMWPFTAQDCGRSAIRDATGRGNHIAVADGACASRSDAPGGGAGDNVWRLTGRNGDQLRGTLRGFAGGSSPVTLATWIRYTAFPSNDGSPPYGAGAINMGGPGAQQHLYLRAYTWGVVDECAAGAPKMTVGADMDAATNGWWCEQSAPDIVLNEWVHFAVTYEDSTVRLYQNGQLVLTPTLAAALQLMNTVSVGCDGHNDNGAVADVDDARVYGVALGADEIAELYGA